MKLSKPQRRVLTNLVEGRPIYHGCKGKSFWGGLSHTIYALRRRKLIDAEGEITDAGREALVHSEGKNL